MKRFTWLYPGMQVKRWVLLIFLGLFLVSVGLTDTLVLLKSTIERSLTYPTYLNLVLIGGGLMVSLGGIIRLTRSLLTQVVPSDGKDLVDIVYRQRLLKKGPRVVAIGGGTGLPAVLHGLKKFTSNITAVVTVSDDGGSSGELRKRLQIPPPGDIRNCLVALADAEPLMGKLFQYRFTEEANISSHNFGNLFIAALTAVVGDFEEAIRQSSRILTIQGKVVPVTAANVRLKAYFTDGSTVEGEAQIPKQQKTIKHIELLPADCLATSDTITQIAEAEIIVLGPGSLYTSIIPNLLVKGVPEAIRQSKALKIYISNIMTQPGESNGFSVSQHIEAIQRLVGDKLVDYVLVNNAPIPAELLTRYEEDGASPVACDTENLTAMTLKVICEPLISQTDFVRHDGEKLASAIFDLWLKSRNGGMEGIRV